MTASENREGRTPSHNSARKRRRRRKRKSPIVTFFKVFFLICLIAGFAVGGAVLGAVMGIVEGTPLLNTEDVVPESYTSFIYDEAGNEIDMLHGEENREYVKLDAIPLALRHAVVAIEDERFYTHNGIDIRGIGRAFVSNIQSRTFSQGASTITQQLIKNEVLSSEKKLERKVKEQYLALSFEKSLMDQWDSKQKVKDYILEMYLNSIALNHGLNGVEAAAKYYFGKHVEELTLAESACIAGITKNPSLYSPVSHPDKSKERQMVVLGKMLSLGYITQEEHDQAAAEDIMSKLVGGKQRETEADAKHSYFVDALIVQVAEDLMTQKNMSKSQAYNMIYSGGLKINATVDLGIQATMEEAYQNDALFPPKGNTLDVSYTISVMDNETQEQTHHTKTATVKTQEAADVFAEEVRAEYLNSSNTMVADKLIVTESLQSAMVLMDYHTGQVKALVGGRGKKVGDLVFNRATQALRQPGSAMKPLGVYAPAIDLGLVMPGSVVNDEPFTVNGWSPRNWNGRFVGPVTIREAIRDSMNVVAAKTVMEVGIDKSYEYLKNFGIELDQADRAPAPLALGGLTHGMTVLEMTAAYGAIANDGLYYKPKFYTTIYDHKGEVFLSRDEEPTRVIKATTAYLLTDMMRDVLTGGGSATGRLANFSGMHIAGKTGTTTDDKDLTFAGYTPYYVAGVWLGYDNPKRMSYDKSYHLLLWKNVMQKVHQSLEDKEFPRPSGIENRTYCMLSGGVPNAYCSEDYYGGGTISELSTTDFPGSHSVCSYHKIYRINSADGKLATPETPSDQVIEVSLAVDPSTGEIMNKPNPIPEGKLDINIHENSTNEPIGRTPVDGEYGNDYMIPIGGETNPTHTNPDPMVPPHSDEGDSQAPLGSDNFGIDAILDFSNE